MGVSKKFGSRVVPSSEVKIGEGPEDDLRSAQTKRLISEYEKIANPEVREEFIALMQVVCKKPELLLHPKGKRTAQQPKFFH